jgi:hypothetical protein
MDRIAVLFVGDGEWPEFREVHQWLAERTSLTDAADVPAALSLVANSQSDPTLIVLAQRWPGEFSGARIDHLRQAAPLARLLELLGAWCERPVRGGEQVPGTLSHYWHQWIARFAPEFSQFAAGAQPVWSLPATANEEERLLVVSDRPRRSNQGLLAIHTRNADTGAALCDAAAGRGFAAVWVRGHQISHLAGIRAAVWDAANSAPAEARELTEWRAALGGVPIVALLDLPRVEDRMLFSAAGAAAVVSKPFWLDDVFWQIERL